MPEINSGKKGAALIITFIVLVSLTLAALGFLTLVGHEIRGAGKGLLNMQAFYIAEAGRAKARWALTNDGAVPPWSEEDGELDTELVTGTFTVTATDDNGDGTVTTITSSGYIPDNINPIVQRRVIERNITIGFDAGDNLALGASASASAVQGSFVAANANDGDSGTKWKSNINNGSWLKLDFGSAATFNQIVIDGTKIDSYTIEYSTDDVEYYAVGNLIESPDWTFTFDLVSARYLRFNVNGNRPEVNEMETYNASAGSATLGQGDFATIW